MENQAWLLLEKMACRGIIRDPTVAQELLNLLPSLPQDQQIGVINQLLLIARTLLHNSSLLADTPTSGQIGSTLDQLISLSLGQNSLSPIVFENLLELTSFLVYSVGVKKANTSLVFKYLANNDCNSSRISRAIKLLTILIAPNKFPAPYSYFYFSSGGSGLEIDLTRQKRYPFVQAFGSCFWLRLEELSEQEVSRLFVFHSKDCGGLEGYFVGNKLYYRTLGQQYTLPHQGSNGILLCEFPYEEWFFLAMEHQRPRFGKNQLRVVVNGEEVLNTHMDFPKFKSQNLEMNLAGVCLDFTGQLAAAMFFNDLISVQKMKTIYSYYHYAPQGHQAFKSLYRVIDKNLCNKLAIFYHPLRSQKRKAYDAVSRTEANMIGMCGVKQLSKNRMCFLGGVCSLLPIITKISRVPSGHGKLFQDWLKLLISCLRERPENQLQACSVKLFKCLSELLLLLPPESFIVAHIDLLQELNNCLMPQLKDQMILQLFWFIELWHQTEFQVHSRILQILNSMYLKSSKALSKTIGVQKILEFLLQYYNDHQNSERCLSHASSLVQILESILLSTGDQTAPEIKHIIGALFSKPAACIQQALLGLLKKVLHQRKGDVVGAPANLFAKHFVDNHGLESLLFVISTTSSPDIRALCLTCIQMTLAHPVKYSFLGSQKQIFSFISCVMLPPAAMLTQTYKRFEQSHREESPKLESTQEDFLGEIAPRFAQLDISEDPRVPLPPPSPKGKAKFNMDLDFQDRADSPMSDRPQLELPGMKPPPAPTSKKKINFTFPKGQFKSNTTKPSFNFASFDDDQLVVPPPPPKKRTFKLSMPDVEDLELLEGSVSQRAKEEEKQPKIELSKTLQKPKEVKSFSESRKFRPGFLSSALNIDTDQINANYTCGGEKGEIMRELQQEDPLIQEIRQLAAECVKYIRGELEMTEDLHFFPLPPPSMRPDSVRGVKTIDFSKTIPSPSHPIIEEVSLELSPTSMSMSPRRDQEQNVYNTVLNMVLKRSTDSSAIIDDSEKIQSKPGLSILQDIVTKGSLHIKHKAVQDMLMLTKWNQQNASILVRDDDWHFWILNLLIELPQNMEAAVAVADIGQRVHTIVMKQAMLVEEQGWKYIRRMINWYQLWKNDQKAKILVKTLFQQLTESIQQGPTGFLQNLSSTLWKNLVITSYLIQQFVLNSSHSQNSEIYKHLLFDKQQSEDASLMDVFFSMLDLIRPYTLQQSKSLQAKSVETSRTDQQSNTKIHALVLKTASEQCDLQDQKKSAALVQIQQCERQRKHLLNKRFKQLTEWRGAWCVDSTTTMEPYPIMDCQFSRPFLKKKSQSYDYFFRTGASLNREDPDQLMQKVQPLFKLAEDVSQQDSGDFDQRLSMTKLQRQESPLAAVLARENSLIQVQVGWIMPLTVKYGLLQIIVSKSDQKMRFVYDNRENSNFMTKIELFEYSPSPNKPYVKEWNLQGLNRVIPKTYVMRHTAVQMFFTDGRSVLFNFTSQKERLVFTSQLRKLKKSALPKAQLFKFPNPCKLISQSDMTARWMNWKISNFQYLMFLNIAAGRSFHDLTQYPVFPWVLQDYSSEYLDLQNPGVFRNLSKNMGSLGPQERTQRFVQKFEGMIGSQDTPPFHYGSHYSNPGIVLFYLLRMFPYSEGARELQDGKWDIADRLFLSVKASYESASQDMVDVREVIPQFFINAEVFQNSQNLALGYTQHGQRVNHVNLPKWANTPQDFVRLHRLALESDYVSENLHKWIDLIFGYKQRGPEAEKAYNVFHHMTYENTIDLDKIEDEGLRSSLETQVVYFGKTPSQLFIKPHPPKENKLKISGGPNIVAQEAQLKIYLPAHRKQWIPNHAILNYFDLGDRSIIKARLFKDREICALRLNGNFVRYNWWPAPMGETKTPFTCALNKESSIEKTNKQGAVETKDRSLFGFNAPIQILNQGRVLVQGGYWDGRLSFKKTNSKDAANNQWKHHSTVTCLDIDDNQRVGITGAKDGDVLVWQMEGDFWHPRWQYIDHDDIVTSVNICQDLHTFASCSLDGTCNIYSLRKGKLLRVLTLPHNAPAVMVKFASAPPAKVILFSPDGNTLYSFSVNGEPLFKTNQRCFHVISPIIVRDLNFQEFLIYGTENGDIVFRYAGTLEHLRRFTLSASSPVLTLMVTPDLRFLLAGGADGELTVLTDPEATLSMLKKQWQLGSVFQIVQQDVNGEENVKDGFISLEKRIK